jgi:hypothetical protein
MISEAIQQGVPTKWWCAPSSCHRFVIKSDQLEAQTDFTSMQRSMA